MLLDRPIRTRALVLVALVATLAGACGKDEAVLQPSGPNDAGGIETDQDVARDGSLADVAVRLEPVATLNHPVALASRPGSDDLWVAQQGGTIRRVVIDPATGAGTVADAVVLDVADAISAGGERGLLGLAFSADGEHLYTYATATDGALTLDEYAMDGEVADPASRRLLLSIPHPRPNHNGGQLQLGPDGFLYLGPGDGGGAGDPDQQGQRTDTLPATLLRIDPTAPADGRPYGIPEGNPFADGAAPEVWAYGLRNPWRFSFDRATGDLWIGDVGQDEVEEIDFVPASADGTGRGLNFGWSLMEGNQPFKGGTPPANHTPPLFDYRHDDGNCTVIGGYVYRGDTIPDLDGAYVYGDYCASGIRVLRQRDGAVTDERALGVTVDQGSLSSFGEGPDGELYVLSLTGEIYRLAPA